MGAISSKHESLQTLNNSILSGQTLACIQFMGTPIGDGFRTSMVTDKRFRIIDDVSDLSVGDLAYSGNILGVVTAVNTERVSVSYPQVRQTVMPSSKPDNRVIVYNLESNSTTNTGDEILVVPNALLSLGVVFLKENEIKALAARSTVAVSANTAAADGVESVVVTITIVGIDGNNKGIGGDTVVVSATGDAVASAVTDNGDGTYTATVVNSTAETSTVTATLDGDDIGAPDSEDIVFS